MNWQDFLPAARAIVEAEHKLWPNSGHMQCGGGGGGSSKFSRKGTGVHERYYSVPSDISNLINDNVANSATDPALAAKQSSLFGRLMDETPEAQPGFQQLLNAANLDTTNFAGRSALEATASRDPYGGQYEADTMAAYQQRASDALAMAGTGPDAVRGGDQRTGIAHGVLADRLAQGRGAEIRSAQQQDVSNVLGAAQGLANVELGRVGVTTGAARGLSDLATGVAGRGLEAGKALDINKLNNLQLLQLAASLQGSTLDKQSDDFSGYGSQDNWQGGLSCCFIFMESLNGALPWYVEAARIDLWTPMRRRGYKWMADWLVPLMRKSRTVRWFVNTTMVKPFLKWGAWLYGETDSWVSASFAPLCKTWLALWALIGRK